MGTTGQRLKEYLKRIEEKQETIETLSKELDLTYLDALDYIDSIETENHMIWKKLVDDIMEEIPEEYF